MPTVVTDRAQFRATAHDAHPGSRIPVEVRVPVADPFDAYRRARTDSEPGVYLETTGGQPGWGYFGVEPVTRLQVGPDLVARDGETGDTGDTSSSPPSSFSSSPSPSSPSLSSPASSSPSSSSSSSSSPPLSSSSSLSPSSPTLAELAALLDGEALARGDCDVPYPCGAFGWLSYDVARELEDLPDNTTDDRGLPNLQVAIYDTVAAWREPRDGETTLRITSCPRVGGGDGRDGRDGLAETGSRRTPLATDGDAADADTAYDRGRKRALALAREAVEGDPSVGPPPVRTERAAFESDCTREEFTERVRRVKRYVRAGDTFQANVSQRLSAPAAVHPVEAFAALRRVNPAPYSALLEFPGVDIVSASPELLLRREVAEPRQEGGADGPSAGRGDRLVTEPIAGTRPRGRTPEADAALERDLLADEKERAEHAMLVDLERNDLGKVCEYGSVEVPEYRRVDRYAEVMHLVSVVEGRPRADCDLADAIAAVFPGGTVTGAPKPRTMEIIDEVEETRRGPYTGSVGVFGFDGRATLDIVIRTLVRRGDRYDLRVGAGIVHDSDPDREYEETLAKGRALVTALDEALGERADLAIEGEVAD